MIIQATDDRRSVAVSSHSERCSMQPDPSVDLETADDFLAKWDRFASLGDESIDPPLCELAPNFEAALTRLLNRRDRRAPARLVFYAVIQIGGFIDIESELAQAALPILGNGFRVVTFEDGDRALAAPDLYFWWQENKSKYDSFPLLEEWRTREFTTAFVIPMYHNIDYEE